MKLAQDGWRVVYLVKGSAAERAGECTARFAEHGILLHILSNVGESIWGEAPIKFLWSGNQCRLGAAKPAQRLR